MASTPFRSIPILGKGIFVSNISLKTSLCQ
jgi:hypothetical protein